MKIIIRSLPYLTEFLYFLSPLLVLHYIDEKNIAAIIKNTIFCLAAIYSIKTLIPLLYKNFACQRKHRIQSVLFYLQLFTTAIIIIISTRLLKANLPELSFTLFLCVLFLTALEAKLIYEKDRIIYRTVITFYKFFLTVFVAFFIYTSPQPVPLSFLSIMLALPAAALTGSQIFLESKATPTISHRIPGMLFLFSIWLAGAMAFLHLIHIGHFALFLLLPLIIKFTPGKKTPLNHNKNEQCYRYTHITFLLFIGIMVLIRLSFT